MGSVTLVHSGEAWEHAQPPCSRQMIRHLERNEGLVTWVQPKGGTVKDQFPVMRLADGHYYTMSLRMMKAVWRSVRLKRGFVNVERAPFGGEKLRIPSLLFVEKMRTQCRFNVSRRARVIDMCRVRRGRLLKTNRAPLSLQLMRSSSLGPAATTSTMPAAGAGAGAGGGRKVTHNASSKVAVVVERMLLPLLDAPMRTHVVFDALPTEEDQGALDLVEDVERRHPEAVADRASFVGYMSTLYDRYRAFCRGGYAEVSTRASPG